MPKRYMPLDEEAQNLADEVLRAHHGDLIGLADCKVVFRFIVNEDAKGRLKYPKPNKHGVVVLGRAKCYSAADRSAGCPDFLVTLLYNFWEQATYEQRRALVDHELCHCGVEDDGDNFKPMSVPHEFEGFLEELQRHGPWDHKLRQVDDQLRLWGEQEMERKGQRLMDALDQVGAQQ